jgi:AcrR family transcriptional regulator
MKSESTPRGREDVREALIAAAAELFALRGPTAVSVRELAQHAKVNHGLVHRHFGSKHGLLQAVLSHLAADIASQVGEASPDEALGGLVGSVLGATSKQGAWLRIMAWAILDGADIGDIQGQFPMAERMVAAARANSKGTLDPEARVTLIMSAGLGMMLFGPFLQRATGQDDTQWARSRQQILSLVGRGGSPFA